MAFQMTDIIPALPEIFLAGLALVLVLVAAFGGEGAGNARRVTRLSLVGIAIAMFLLVQGDAMPSLAFGGMFAADSFAFYMKALVLVGTFAALLLSLGVSI